LDAQLIHQLAVVAVVMVELLELLEDQVVVAVVVHQKGLVEQVIHLPQTLLKEIQVAQEPLHLFQHP
jgi:hypothetical protein